MRTTLLAGTALAGSLLMSTFIWESAQATSAPGLKGALVDSSTVTLVRDGGGTVVVVAVAVGAAAIQVVAAATAVAPRCHVRWWRRWRRWRRRWRPRR